MKNNAIFNRTYLLGDIHGNWHVIQDHLSKIVVDNVAYIQVGDFGIGFYSNDEDLRRLKILNEKLIEHNSFLYVIRGNHDRKDWFMIDKMIDEKNQLSNIFFVPDYTVLNIDNENILFIPGAISIDRVYRKKNNMGWWADEVVVFDFDKASEYLNIDRIISHTAPDFCQPTSFNDLVNNYALYDKCLLNDLSNERANMSKLVSILMKNNKIKSLHYGHFHQSYYFRHNDCDFIGLGVNEFYNL